MVCVSIERHANTLPYQCQCVSVFDSVDTCSYVGSMRVRDILLAIMKAKGHNAYAVEEITGVPQPTVQRIVTGKHGDPRTETVQKLAAGYKVDESQMRGLNPIPWLAADTTGEEGPSSDVQTPHGEVVQFTRHPDPTIEKVIKLMESTDDLGRQRILGIVEGALAGQTSTSKANAQ